MRVLWSHCRALRSWWGVLDATLCDKVCQWLATGRWFSPGTLVSSTNKTDHQDITEILLKVALNTINQPTTLLQSYFVYRRKNQLQLVITDNFSPRIATCTCSPVIILPSCVLSNLFISFSNDSVRCLYDFFLSSKLAPTSSSAYSKIYNIITSGSSAYSKIYNIITSGSSACSKIYNIITSGSSVYSKIYNIITSGSSVYSKIYNIITSGTSAYSKIYNSIT
jgi:hypothetical protein